MRVSWHDLRPSERFSPGPALAVKSAYFKLMLVPSRRRWCQHGCKGMNKDLKERDKGLPLMVTLVEPGAQPVPTTP